MIRHPELLPPEAARSIQLYLEEGKDMGQFLTAIFANDLFEACGRADDKNKYRLFDYVFWIYNYAPGNCHGSYEIVKSWIKNHNSRKKESE
jgi:hypothetical protein